MALTSDKRKWFCLYLLTVYIGFNDGLQFVIRTPLIGITLHHRWIVEQRRKTSIGLGLVSKIWQFEGDYIYRWWKEYEWC